MSAQELRLQALLPARESPCTPSGVAWPSTKLLQARHMQMSKATVLLFHHLRPQLSRGCYQAAGNGMPSSTVSS